MSRVFTCGFESGYMFGGIALGGTSELTTQSNSGSDPVAAGQSIVTNPPWWLSRGKYVMQMVGGHNAQTNFSVGGVWFGFKFGTDTLPDGEAAVLYAGAAGAAWSIKLQTDGSIKYYNTVGGVTAKYQSPAGLIPVLTTCLLEFKIKTGDHQIWVNGVKLFSDTDAGDDLPTLGGITFNNHLNATTGCTFYFDDIYMNTETTSASGQSGRRGWASVCPALVPNGDIGSSPVGFTNSAGLTFGNAVSGWFSAIDDALPYAGGVADFIGKSTASTVYYESSFTPSLSVGAINAVYLVCWGSGATASSDNITFLLRSNGADGPTQAFTQTYSVAHCQTSDHGDTDLAAGSVAWTKALVDGAHLKWGNSSDVSPNPKLYAAYLCYEAPDPSLIYRNRNVILPHSALV